MTTVRGAHQDRLLLLLAAWASPVIPMAVAALVWLGATGTACALPELTCLPW
jgi:hypothetical protein